MTWLQPNPSEKKEDKEKKKKAATNSSQIRTILKVPFKCQGIFLARSNTYINSNIIAGS
jgi:hypothetical protein